MTGLALGLTAAVVVLGPTLVLADDYGLGATADAAKIPKDKTVQTVIGSVIGTALSMISVLFFALMLYAGIKWMLARGDSDEARKALDTIIAAIIGMLIVLGSYAITNFVFGTLGQGGPSTPTAPAVGSCYIAPGKTGEMNCSVYTNGTSCEADSNCDWAADVAP